MSETKPVSLSNDPPRRGGRGPDLPETKEKRVIREGTRRATKRDGSAASAGLRPGKPAPAPLRSKSDWSRPPPGARASRPHPLPLPAAQFPRDAPAGHPAGGNRMGPAEEEPWRLCRSIRVEEMGEAVPGFLRAGRPRSRGTSSHDMVTPRGQNCRSTPGPLVFEGGPSLFVFIRVHSWFVFIQ